MYNTNTTQSNASSENLNSPFLMARLTINHIENMLNSQESPDANQLAFLTDLLDETVRQTILECIEHRLNKVN